MNEHQTQVLTEAINEADAHLLNVQQDYRRWNPERAAEESDCPTAFAAAIRTSRMSLRVARSILRAYSTHQRARHSAVATEVDVMTTLV